MTYVRSVKIYEERRLHNMVLAQGFLPDASATKVDRFLYPDEALLMELRSALLKYRLGPYRFLPPGVAN